MQSMSESKRTNMDLETLNSSLDLLEASNIKEARLLGGEPTLHPSFNEILDVCLNRGFRVMLFSGGLMPKKVLDKIESLPDKHISILINIFYPGQDKPSLYNKHLALFRRLGRKIILGANIASPNIDLGFLIPLIQDYQLAPILRLGIAHPGLIAENAYLHPRHYPEVGHRIAILAQEAQRKNISIEFDCGFVPCMFPSGVLKQLNSQASDVGLRCNPILDILPNGDVISCYALSSYSTDTIKPKDTTQQIQIRFTQRQLSERTITLYKHCSKCHWKEKSECVGGCLSASMQRQRRTRN